MEFVYIEPCCLSFLSILNDSLLDGLLFCRGQALDDFRSKKASAPPPIIDCFDGMPITWTVGTSPNAELVNTMLDNAIVLLKENEHPIVHSDRGCHYRWSGWIQRMDEAGLTRSMSKKGCSPDNSACEGFFGRMKNEMFYGEKWDKISVEEFISIINQYMQWYRDKRIKLSLGGLSPMEYRRSLGIA